jgi:hypothetical protein
VYLGHVGLEEELEVVGDDPLGHGVDVVEGIPRGLEREEADQANNLIK